MRLRWMADGLGMERAAGGAHAGEVEIGTVELTMRRCNKLLRRYFS
jgi:hypothetical protein